MIEYLFNTKIIVLVSLLFLIVFLYLEIASPIILLGTILVFYSILGVLTPEDILSGLSNQQIAIIAMLLVISYVIKKTGVIEYIFEKLFKKTKSYKLFLLKLGIFTSFFSSFLNNTPIVAMFTSHIQSFAAKKNISVSKLLIPLSYFAILGGTVTLIGTSTNLIINSLYIEKGYTGFSLFEFSIVGIPLVIVGMIYLFFFAEKLLPKNKNIENQFKDNLRNYLVEFKVKKKSNLIGKSIQENRMRNLKNLYLAEIIRNNKSIKSISASEMIYENDLLIFAGDTKNISEINKRFHGLELISNENIKSNINEFDLVEVVIGSNSNLINKKLNETNFRNRYNSTVLGIYRGAEKLSGKLGKVIIKAGDNLLLNINDNFYKNNVDDFYIISKRKEKVKKPNMIESSLIMVGFFTILILSMLNLISLFTGLFVFIGFLVLFKIISVNEIKKALDFNLIAIAVAALAIGKGLINSGVADSLANITVNIFEPLGILGFLIGIYIITNILTEVITNIAAASIVFPVALSIAEVLSLNPTPFVLTVAFAASASFITPFGYQTNLIVYSAGGYKFKDFVRIGLPLSILCLITTVSVLYVVYF